MPDPSRVPWTGRKAPFGQRTVDQLLTLLAKDVTVKQAAAQLGITYFTAKQYLARERRRLHAQTTTYLVVRHALRMLDDPPLFAQATIRAARLEDLPEIPRGRQPDGEPEQ